MLYSPNPRRLKRRSTGWHFIRNPPNCRKVSAARSTFSARRKPSYEYLQDDGSTGSAYGGVGPGGRSSGKNETLLRLGDALFCGRCLDVGCYLFLRRSAKAVHEFLSGLAPPL